MVLADGVRYRKNLIRFRFVARVNSGLVIKVFFMLDELASGYASIVGLLSAFSASRNGQETKDFQVFIEWLI